MKYEHQKEIDRLMALSEKPSSNSNKFRTQLYAYINGLVGYNKESQIAIIWSVEDVQEMDDSLDYDQAIKVLESLKKNHDATIGINWDVISDTITIMREAGEL